MQPLISIIIPVFNSKETIYKTLESISNQSYKNIEVIIVDDFSVDCTRSIIKDYMKRHSNIKLLQTYAEGFSFAQNTALKEAKGKYVVFFKSGNLMSYNLLEYMLKIAEENSADITCCDFFNISQGTFILENFRLPEAPKEKLYIKTPNEYLRKLTTCKEHTYLRTYSLWNKLINKEILTDFSFPVDKFHFDKFAITDIVKRSNKILLTNQILIMNTLVDEFIIKKYFSYSDLEDIEFLQNLLISAKKQNNINDLKNISINLISTLSSTRRKFLSPHFELVDKEEQENNIDLKFNSIYKFFQTKFPDIAKTKKYKKLFKKYFFILRKEKILMKRPIPHINPKIEFAVEHNISNTDTETLKKVFDELKGKFPESTDFNMLDFL